MVLPLTSSSSRWNLPVPADRTTALDSGEWRYYIILTNVPCHVARRVLRGTNNADCSETSRKLMGLTVHYYL